MTINQIIKAGKLVSEVDQIKRISCVNVGFTTNDWKADETQFHVHNLLCSNGTLELSNLFSSLAEELDTKPNYVNNLTVVASADTEEELERMGF